MGPAGGWGGGTSGGDRFETAAGESARRRAGTADATKEVGIGFVSSDSDSAAGGTGAAEADEAFEGGAEAAGSGLEMVEENAPAFGRLTG
jgi:hypothetical protein